MKKIIKKEYKEVLKHILEIILTESNPKPCYYRMLGYSYLHLEKIDKARFVGLIKKLENKKNAH